MPRANAKPSEVEIADETDLAAAIVFNVFLRVSPIVKFNEPAQTLPQAVEIAKTMTANNKFHKKALIYGIDETGTARLVPERLWPQPTRTVLTAAEAASPEMAAKVAEALALENAPLVPLAERRFATKKLAQAAAYIAGLTPTDFALEVIPVAGGEAVFRIEQIVRDEPVPAFLTKMRGATMALVAAHVPAPPAKVAAPKAASANAAPKPLGKRAQADANAAAGILPVPPDFSAPTHKGYLKKLAHLVALVEARDVAALEAYAINPYASSMSALLRYKTLATTALKARG